MSVGMNRVWSLYLMLQIASNIKNLAGITIPASANIVVEAMYNISNFKIFES
jgi:hypothetical protein